jgi:hypothetical protein
MRQIQIALLVTIVLCMFVGEMAARAPARYHSNTLFHALSLISISLVGATVVVRRTLVLRSEILLKERHDDGVTDGSLTNDGLAMARWRTGYLFLYALCELLGLFGLSLRLVGFPLANVWGFYLGGFLLLLLYSPRSIGVQAGVN